MRTPDSRFENLEGFPFEPNYMEIQGLRVHYLNEGPRDGDPIFLLHEEPVWSYLFHKMIPVLTDAGHRVIVPDMVGFGRPDKPLSMDAYSYQFHVDTDIGLKTKHMSVSSNLSMLRPVAKTLADDPKLGPMLSESEIENLRKFRQLHRQGGDQVAYDAVKSLHAAGITIVAGTDTPNAGATEGASLHLELKLLVEAGLSPVEALKTATSNAADAFRLADRDWIKAGLREFFQPRPCASMAIAAVVTTVGIIRKYAGNKAAQIDAKLSRNSPNGRFTHKDGL